MLRLTGGQLPQPLITASHRCAAQVSLSLAVLPVLREEEEVRRWVEKPHWPFSMSCAGDIPRENCLSVMQWGWPSDRYQRGYWALPKGHISTSFILAGGNSSGLGRDRALGAWALGIFTSCPSSGLCWGPVLAAVWGHACLACWGCSVSRQSSLSCFYFVPPAALQPVYFPLASGCH